MFTCCDKYREIDNALGIKLTVIKLLNPFHLHQPEFQHVQDPSSPVFSLFCADLQQNGFKKYFEYIPVSV